MSQTTDTVISIDASLIIAVLALLFTVGSFWWLHARRGRLVVSHPHTYAFVGTPDTLRLRFPMAIYNTGATALIVQDMRVVSGGERTLPPLRWITTRSVLKPTDDDGFAFATGFAIQGRSTREVIANSAMIR